MAQVNALLAEHLPAVIVGVVDSFFVRKGQVLPTSSFNIEYSSWLVGISGHPEYVLDRCVLPGDVLRGVAQAGYEEMADSMAAHMRGHTDRLTLMGWLNNGLFGACAGHHSAIEARLIAYGADYCRYCRRSIAEHVADAARKS